MANWRRYADVAVGEIFPPEPTRFEVTEAAIDDFLAATGETPDELAGSTAGNGEAPAALAVIYVTEALQARGGRPGGVHARQRFIFHRAPRVGETLFTQGRVSEKYERKSRNWIVSETVTRDAAGLPVTTGITTGIWGPED